MFQKMLNLEDEDGQDLENIQSEFNRRNAIQSTDNKSYRLFLDQLYKYKYTLKNEDSNFPPESLVAPDINDYDFDKVLDSNLTMTDYDEFVDENIKKFEQKNNFSVSDDQIISWAAQQDFEAMQRSLQSDKQF